MKRILYFYPHKFAGLTDGIHTRIVTILEYFKSRGFLVDMVNYENPEIKESFLQNNKLVNNLYLVSDNPFIGKNTSRESGSFKFLKRKFLSLKPWLLRNVLRTKDTERSGLPNLMTTSLADKVEDLLAKNKYEAVLVTYSYWADLVKPLTLNYPLVKKVIDPTDFLTLHQLYGNRNIGYDQLGEMFGDELERMSYFDDIIHISYDEQQLFSNFIPEKRHHFIPQFFDKTSQRTGREIKYDISLIASGNTYNVEGVTWFFDKVYPLLNKNIKIAIAGTICNKILFDADNIVKLGFIDDVEELYQTTRCTICPLKRGSGMKIKVIESLSYSLPVVSTLKGVDGFFNKDLEGGVLIADEPEKFAKHLTNLIEDPGYYELQVKFSSDLFGKYFSRDANYSRLDAIFS